MSMVSQRIVWGGHIYWAHCRHFRRRSPPVSDCFSKGKWYDDDSGRKLVVSATNSQLSGIIQGIFPIKRFSRRLSRKYGSKNRELTPNFLKRITGISAQQAGMKEWATEYSCKRPFLTYLSVMWRLRSSFDNGICRGEIEHAPNCQLCSRWSGWRDSNPRPSGWKPDALTSELQPHVATGTLKGVLLAHSISIPNFWASLQRKFLLIT